MTGVPRDAIRELAHAYGRAEHAQLCWTLGITEHHNAVDNVLALINLSLLTGQVGRYGSGLQPLRGQNNVQGGGDMGAIPNRLPGFQELLDPVLRGEVRRGVEHHDPAAPRAAPDRDVRGDGARRAHGRLLRRREPRGRRGRPAARDPAARGARPPRRPGPLPDPDGRARGRRPPGGLHARRGRGDGHLERAPRAARPQGRRAAGPGARRHRARLRARAPPRSRARQPARAGRLGRAALALAHARRHELRAPRPSRRDPVALLGRVPSRRPVPARPPLGRGGRRPRALPAWSSTIRRWTSSTTTSRCG